MATVDDLVACNLLCRQIHGFVGEASENENREREIVRASDPWLETSQSQLSHNSVTTQALTQLLVEFNRASGG